MPRGVGFRAPGTCHFLSSTSAAQVRAATTLGKPIVLPEPALATVSPTKPRTKRASRRSSPCTSSR
ncbi:MAG: hypothetical protein MZV63_40150 [Marinilabiliales bacterium]|nr:hypothetical protein [Marinilabiliales bacterium]